MEFKTLGNTTQKISAVGQGTGVGGNLAKTAVYGEKHVEALKLGIDLGMTFIDTAEEYGRGDAEGIVAKAIKGIRDKVFIATKFSPEHSSRDDILKAAEGSLCRLQTDYIDLYQVHWPNPKVQIDEIRQALDQLLKQNKIRHIGVCNFALEELREAEEVFGAERIVSIQMEYNLFDRSIEKDLLPYCEQKNITTIAYSPLDQGRIGPGDEKMRVLNEIAVKYEKTAAQIALRWLVSHKTVIAIPNATSENHVLENSVCLDFDLKKEDFERISKIFKVECIYVSTDRIKIEGKDPALCQSMEDALLNKMGFVPSPLDLASRIQKGVGIKPIRVVCTKDKSGRYDFDLREGRVRYWAWVIAHKGLEPIPAFIREN